MRRRGGGNIVGEEEEEEETGEEKEEEEEKEEQKKEEWEEKEEKEEEEEERTDKEKEEENNVRLGILLFQQIKDFLSFVVLPPWFQERSKSEGQSARSPTASSMSGSPSQAALQSLRDSSPELLFVFRKDWLHEPIMEEKLYIKCLILFALF